MKTFFIRTSRQLLACFFVPVLKEVKQKSASDETLFADRTGLEPATSAVTGRHSNRLNYRSLLLQNNWLFRFGIAKITGNCFSKQNFFQKNFCLYFYTSKSAHA